MSNSTGDFSRILILIIVGRIADESGIILRNKSETDWDYIWDVGASYSIYYSTMSVSIPLVGGGLFQCCSNVLPNKLNLTTCSATEYKIKKNTIAILSQIQQHTSAQVAFKNVRTEPRSNSTLQTFRHQRRRRWWAENTNCDRRTSATLKENQHCITSVNSVLQ